jgi:hypothetical protein
MLARPPDAQKPSPALSFQNTEQGFFAFQFDCSKNLSEREALHPLSLERPQRAATALPESPQAPAPLQPPEERERRPLSASPGTR